VLRLRAGQPGIGLRAWVVFVGVEIMRREGIREKLSQAKYELDMHRCLLATAHFKADTEDAKRQVEHINYLNFTIRDLEKELEPTYG
jgi:hypothetical protein